MYNVAQRRRKIAAPSSSQAKKSPSTSNHEPSANHGRLRITATQAGETIAVLIQPRISKMRSVTRSECGRVLMTLHTAIRMISGLFAPDDKVFMVGCWPVDALACPRDALSGCSPEAPHARVGR